MKNKSAVQSRANKPSAQKNLTISEVRNDTIVMKDGTLRSVLMVSSINFALKNDDEQQAIINSYVSFLNSLDHPLQIVIQSRQLNVRPYLENLAKKEREQPNELLRMQIADYRSFVSELVDLGKIMSKQFYVIVPYDPLTNKKKGFWSRASEVFNPAITIKLKDERFFKRKYDLDMRVRQVESGLTGMGLEVVRLDTQSLIELFYSTFNPDIALSEPLAPLGDFNLEDA